MSTNSQSSSLRILLDILVEVTDEVDLRDFLEEQQSRTRDTPHFVQSLPPALAPLDAAVAEALMYSSGNPSPQEYGITLRTEDCQVKREDERKVRVQQIVEVQDEVALWKYALARYRTCWGHEMGEDKDAQSMTLPVAVLEAVLLSSESPQPVDYGIEIHAYAASVHSTSSTSPRSFEEIEALLRA